MVAAVLASSTGGSWASNLIGQCAAGDERAWRKLYREHEGTARRFLFRMGVPSEQIDDACQEVFLETFRYLPGFREEADFKTWLYRLCLTQARKHRNKRRLQSLLLALVGNDSPESLDRGQMLEEQMKRLVVASLDALPEKQRQVLVLYEFEGQSGEKIAEITGCTESSVWRLLHHARKRFRSRLLEKSPLP